MPLPNEDIYETKKGGGCAALFGLPFLLAGLGVIVAGFIPADVRGGDDFSPFFAIPFGGVFAAVGATIVFGRFGLVIDRRAGTLVKWWGLLVPMKRSEYAIADFDSISATKEVRQSKNSSYNVYPVYLNSSKIEKPLKIFEERQRSGSRIESEKLAKFLRLPIHDKTSGSTQIRQHDSLDESIKDQFDKGKLTNELPEPPSDLKAKIDYDGINLKIETPKGRLRPAYFIPILFFSAFEAIIFLNFVKPILSHEQRDSSPIFLVIAGLFLVVPLFGILVVLRRLILNSQKITVSQKGISVQQSGRKDSFIAREQIEELFIAKTGKGAWNPFGNLITARSDEQTLSFGTNLPEEELKYILALSRGILVS